MADVDIMYAAFRDADLAGGAIFDEANPGNRDNCFLPYIELRKILSENSIYIDTPDGVNGKKLIFEIHQNVQRYSVSQLRYLLMLETRFVWRKNGDANELAKYKKIFTWNDELVDGERFIKLNFPNTIQVHPVDGFEGRERFCCLIAGNKTLATRDERNLYPERVKAIRWFEKHAPKDFDLFGTDWDMPVLHRGVLGKIERRFYKKFGRLFGLCPFPSYRGRVGQKRDVLLNTRFAICYENVRDMPGYITEKIFDCFFSGCVPVYWGANNVSDHIPADCYIDRRKFADTAAVYAHLKAMDEVTYCAYQQRIADFLASDAAKPFSSEFFAETIVRTIVNDLGCHA